MREIRTGQFYRHFKGGLYQIVGWQNILRQGKSW